MNKKPVGRPLKKGAKKSGDLFPGECRFSFIADKKTVNSVKSLAKSQGRTIKEFMGELLKMANKKDTPNEAKLKAYLNNKKALPVGKA